MKIGVISDTHIPYRVKKIPDIVLQLLTGIDHIFHAGDIADFGVIRKLE
jgi:predicted phosphodiesterase